MNKYRKKPVIVEAVQLLPGNQSTVAEWIGRPVTQLGVGETSELLIVLQGTMKASLYDWVIRGISGEHYPCKPEIFELTYEAIEE